MASGEPEDRGEPPAPTVATDLGVAKTVVPAGTDLGLAQTVAPGLEDPHSLDKRPDGDKLARQVARTRIANKLFQKTEHVKLGRYHLLELVGTGGMGVVWGAWDPELERRVAIKLVKATVRAARDRILLEGQALAKLSHPNVVPVYDVGVVEEQVYLVMEWVRGENLRAYCRKPHAIREIVSVYRAAGEGLFAAHTAGLIHRDFKPDNAMRGDDGRVRVLDFGLAREDLRAPTEDGDLSPVPSSDATRGAGTPRYMPSEQAEGGPLTPSVDQYAFCVSLREALIGRNATGKDADVPRWLDVIISKGTESKPENRYESMGVLLHALSRDPATIRRRRLLVGGAVAAVAAAFVVGNVRGSGNEVERCIGGKDQIAKSWNAGTRKTLIEHVTSLGAYGAQEASHLSEEIAAYGRRWAFAHHATCMTHERGELTNSLYERTLGCLTRTKVGFDTVIEVLTTTNAERLSNAIVAASSLPNPDACGALTLASSNVEPPPAAIQPQVEMWTNTLERLRVLAQSDDQTASTQTAAAVASAEKLQYVPLIAKALLVHGFALLVQDRSDKMPESITALHRAAELALEANDDVLFVEAYAREVFAVAVTSKQDVPQAARDAMGAIPFAEHISNRLGSAGEYGRALLFMNIANAKLASGDKVSARYWADRSLAEARVLRPNDVELVNVYGTKAIVAESSEERAQLFTRERESFARLLGENHRSTLLSRMKAQGFIGNPLEAAKELREVCALYDRYHATLQSSATDYCNFYLGWLAEERGDLEEARTALQRVGEEGPAKEVVRAHLLMIDGKLEQAITEATAYAQTANNEWWTLVDVADAWMVAALSQGRLRRPDPAIANLRRALAILEGIEAVKTNPQYHRRIERIRALLARALASTQPAEAKQLATEAAVWYRAVGGYEAIATEMESIAKR
jgi:tetratricopeptide (TPR) repeat protein